MIGSRAITEEAAMGAHKTSAAFSQPGSIPEDRDRATLLLRLIMPMAGKIGVGVRENTAGGNRSWNRRYQAATSTNRPGVVEWAVSE